MDHHPPYRYHIVLFRTTLTGCALQSPMHECEACKTVFEVDAGSREKLCCPLCAKIGVVKPLIERPELPDWFNYIELRMENHLEPEKYRRAFLYIHTGNDRLEATIEITKTDKGQLALTIHHDTENEQLPLNQVLVHKQDQTVLLFGKPA